jgi:hypothetical protein
VFGSWSFGALYFSSNPNNCFYLDIIGLFFVVRFYPVPDFGVFDFTKEGNVTAYFDRLFWEIASKSI